MTTDGQTHPPKTTGLAISSLVLGILSLACLGPLTGIPAIICGHVAKSRIGRSAGSLAGDGLALAGLILGYISLALFIAIVPLYLAIAIPSFVHARDAAQRSVCINNLRQMEAAKEMWAMENGASEGDPVTDEDVGAYLRLPIGDMVCPNDGTYSLNAIGTPPTCSIEGHTLDYTP